MSWNETAWTRHLELSRQSGSYGSEGTNPWWHYIFKDGRTIFLNIETAEERELLLSQEQQRILMFRNQLMWRFSFLYPHFTFTELTSHLEERFKRG